MGRTAIAALLLLAAPIYAQSPQSKAPAKEPSLYAILHQMFVSKNVYAANEEKREAEITAMKDELRRLRDENEELRIEIANLSINESKAEVGLRRH